MVTLKIRVQIFLRVFVTRYSTKQKHVVVLLELELGTGCPVFIIVHNPFYLYLKIVCLYFNDHPYSVIHQPSPQSPETCLRGESLADDMVII